MRAQRILYYVLPALTLMALVASPRSLQAVEEIARMEARDVTCAEGGGTGRPHLLRLHHG